MRANLARRGRRLLARHASAPSCAAYAAASACRRPAARPLVRGPCGRTLFNALFQKPPREVRQPEYEPGWMHIMIWRSRMLDKLRPPPRKEMAEAWRKLMQAKMSRRLALNSTQALQCRRLLEWLAETSAAEASALDLSPADLALARTVLLDVEPLERTKNHADLARALHSVCTSGDRACSAAEPQWSYLVQALARYGESLEAAQMLYSRWNEPTYQPYLAGQARLVEAVAHGLAREGREEALVELVEYAEAHGVAYDADLHATMVAFFADQDRVAETKRWFGKPVARTPLRVEAYRSLAAFARRNGLQDWAMPIFVELGQSQPGKEHWDVILQAILLVGKGLGEVAAMMGHMVDLRHGPLSPDTRTVNGLLRTAVEVEDAALANGILELGAQRGLAPDGETYLVLLHMRLASGNLAGTRAVYEQVRFLEPWAADGSRPELFDEFRELMDRYLVLLTRQSPPDFKLVLALLAAVEEMGMLLSPETVGALCVRFLENDEPFDAMDTLAAHSFLYSEAQREVVQAALMALCVDGETSTSRAWRAYQMLHQFFQDTSFERRVRLMEAFFDRRRPDMASQVFGHMRQHRNKAYHPQLDTYVGCLEGLARWPDAEGLAAVHNMLKMDTALQPNTRLYTAMMLAYTACGKPLAALDFWNDITQSREGPSYASLEAVFWALERQPGGDRKAREIWERIERMDLEVPPAVYNAYVGAIAGSGNEKEVRGLIMKMAFLVGSEPGPLTLAVAHNALPGQEMQAGFRDWAQKKYRDAWAELDKHGRRVNEYLLCEIKVDRSMRA